MSDNWKTMLTPAGDPNAEYRQKYGILGEGRFPVAPGDDERGRAALNLCGNGTSKEERKKIILAVAKRCPKLGRACQEALQADKDKGLI